MPQNLIGDVIEEMARHDGHYAIAYALLRLASAQSDTSQEIKQCRETIERLAAEA